MSRKTDYKISVPVMTKVLKRYGEEKFVAELRRVGAQRVFLTRGIYELNEAAFEKMLQDLEQACSCLKAHGFEVGIWGWSFIVKNLKDEFHHVCSLDKKYVDATSACPLDPKFREFVGNYAARLAQTGVDIIQFDDDYRLAYWKGVMACGCDLHMQRICEILGETISAEDFKDKVLSGGENKYRDAYLAVNKEALEGFARHIRKCVDAVNPNIRISVCSCMNWDFDGTDPAQISRIFAGNTKPLMRLIGATYWATMPTWSIFNRLGTVIELERMELSWCGEGIEIMAEGDTYPRPRFHVPASYLELFHTAMLADGGTDGILKYVLDYASAPEYETAYVDATCKNRGLYQKIQNAFSEKSACGVRIVEKQKKFKTMEISEERAGDYSVTDLFFSPAAKMVSSLSIPSTYTGNDGCSIVFGENARDLSADLLRNGAVIDLAAAQILQKAGVDVGLVNIGKKVRPYEEYFVEDDMYVLVRYSANIVELQSSAKVCSQILYTEGGKEERAPASYYYENAQGQRFLVFAFDMHYNDESCYRTYTRGNQLSKAVERLSGTALPAWIPNSPDLYMMCKKGADGSMAVGLWNIFADKVSDPVITLDRAYSAIEFINCSGRIEGNKVYLTEIPAFEFAGFEVKQEK